MVIGTKAEIMKEIGDRMRVRRLSLNLSREVAAARSGLSASTLKNFESGRGITLWGFVSLCRTYGNDGWVYELVPEMISDYADRIKPVKKRLRAAKRKVSVDV